METALYLFIFVLWITSLVWVYRDAELRENNAALAVLLVLFVAWPLSLIIWLLVRKPLMTEEEWDQYQKKKNENAFLAATSFGANGARSICSDCANYIPAHQICSHFAVDLSRPIADCRAFQPKESN